jgi:hypothetical protein
MYYDYLKTAAYSNSTQGVPFTVSTPVETRLFMAALQRRHEARPPLVYHAANFRREFKAIKVVQKE